MDRTDRLVINFNINLIRSYVFDLMLFGLERLAARVGRSV